MGRYLIGYSCIAAAIFLLLLAVLTLVAMLRALAVITTLAAIESAFGSLVLGLLLLFGANRLKQAGMARLKPKARDACAAGGSHEGRQ